MKKQITKFISKTIFAIALLATVTANAQLPSNVLVGYWHNWENLRIKDVDPRYNVIMLSFLEADNDFNVNNNVVGDLSFDMWGNGKSNLIADIPVVQAKGKKVLVSIGGANGSFKLNNVTDKNTYVSKVKAFIQEYKVDGIDLDFEQSVYVKMTSGTMANPATHLQYLIDGTKELLTWYQSTYGKKMLLTMAPECLYVQGGLSKWADGGGSWLPVIEQLRDDLDLLMVQLYNSGGMYDLDLVERQQGNATFIVAMTEAVIRGFTHAQGWGDYSGLPASKVAVALPSCSAAAGSGFVSSADMIGALKYLRGTGPKVGNYTLKRSSGYSDLRGLMTWSINNDYKTTCGGASYSFADAAEQSIGTINVEALPENTNSVLYPNPSNGFVTIQRADDFVVDLTVFDNRGVMMITKQLTSSVEQLDISGLSAGFYTVQIGTETKKLIKK